MDAGEQPVRTLFVHTPTRASTRCGRVGACADHSHAGPATHEIHVALSPEIRRAPTPLELQLEGVDVRRFAVDQGPRRPEGRPLRAAAALTRESVRWLSSLATLARYIRRNRIDVLHTCDRPRDAVATVMLGKLCRVPSIVHVHVAYGDWMSRTRRWSIAHADHRIAVSEFVRGGLIAAGSPSARTHTILNGADPNRSVPDPRTASVREELGIAPTAVVVVSVCRLFEAKGVVELVEAFATFDAGDAYLLIAGQDSSPTQDYLRLLGRGSPSLASAIGSDSSDGAMTSLQ